MSAGAMVAPPMTTGSLMVPTLVLVAPRTRIQRVQIGKPRERNSSVSRTDASMRREEGEQADCLMLHRLRPEHLGRIREYQPGFRHS